MPDRLASPDGSTGLWDPGSRHRHWRLRLGVTALVIVSGYVLLRLAAGGFASELDFLLAALGGVLSGSLVGEHVPIRVGTAWFRRFLLPIVELFVTYSLLAVLLVAVHQGLVALAAVSGLLLACSFGSIVETPPPDPGALR